jgi:hypothetical protein
MSYNNDNEVKTQLLNSIMSSVQNDETKISYNAIQIETEQLLNREKTYFIINTFVSLFLFVVIFKTS